MAVQLKGEAISEEVLVARMVETIVEVASPERIVLFGSRAKGTAREQSDYDFLVIDAKPFNKQHSRRKTAGKIWRALASFRVPTDILIYHTDEVEKWQRSQNHVVFHALNEGKVVYERAEPSGDSAASIQTLCDRVEAAFQLSKGTSKSLGKE